MTDPGRCGEKYDIEGTVVLKVYNSDASPGGCWFLKGHPGGHDDGKREWLPAEDKR